MASYPHQTNLSIPTLVFIDFLQKLNHDFLQCFYVQLVLFTLQHTYESTKYNQKYTVHPKVHKCTFGCTLYPFSFPIEQMLIPMYSCTKQRTLFFQKRKYKVHPKVQSTSESTRYTVHACFNPISRNRLKQKRKVHPQL